MGTVCTDRTGVDSVAYLISGIFSSFLVIPELQALSTELFHLMILYVCERVDKHACIQPNRVFVMTSDLLQNKHLVFMFCVVTF